MVTTMASKPKAEPEPEFELPDGYPVESDQLGLARYFYRREHFPREWWELVELALAGCPLEPLKAFRKTVIGRGNPLTAATADSAIAGALKMIGVDCPANWANSKRTALKPCITYPEGMAARLDRARYLLRNDQTVIFARPKGYKYAADEIVIIKDAIAADVPLSFLEWDKATVARVAAPDAAFAIRMPYVSNPEAV
jgi:hypothetical protein